MNAHAEIAEVWPRDGRIRLVGFIHGAPVRERAGSGWRLLLVLRNREDIQLRYPVALDGSRFDVTVPIGDLTPDALPGSGKWDLHLATDTGGKEPRLRAGRHLDDIRSKKKIMVFPDQRTTSAGTDVSVRPFYTVNNNLSIECCRRIPE